MEDTFSCKERTSSNIRGAHHHHHGHHHPYHLHHNHLPSSLQCSCIFNGADVIYLFLVQKVNWHWSPCDVAPGKTKVVCLLEPHRNSIQINGHPLVEFQGTQLGGPCSVRSIPSYRNLKSLQVAKVNLAVPACANKFSSLCGGTGIKCLAHRESL